MFSFLRDAIWGRPDRFLFELQFQKKTFSWKHSGFVSLGLVVGIWCTRYFIAFCPRTCRKWNCHHILFYELHVKYYVSTKKKLNLYSFTSRWSRKSTQLDTFLYNLSLSANKVCINYLDLLTIWTLMERSLWSLLRSFGNKVINTQGLSKTKINNSLTSRWSRKSTQLDGWGWSWIWTVTLE